MQNSTNENVENKCNFYKIDDLKKNEELKKNVILSVIKGLENNDNIRAFVYKIISLENRAERNNNYNRYLSDIRLIMFMFLKRFIEKNELPDKFNINGVVNFINGVVDFLGNNGDVILKKVFPTKESYQIAYVNNKILLHCERGKLRAICLNGNWYKIKKDKDKDKREVINRIEESITDNEEKNKVIEMVESEKCCNNNRKYIFSPQFFIQSPKWWFFNVVNPYLFRFFRKIEESNFREFYIFMYVIATLSYIRLPADNNASEENNTGNENKNASEENNTGNEKWENIKNGLNEKVKKCSEYNKDNKDKLEEILNEILNDIEKNRISLYTYEGNINIDLIAKIVVIHGISQMLKIIGADNPVLKALKLVLGDEIGSQWKTVFNNLLEDCDSINNQAQNDDVCKFLLNIECLVEKLKTKLENVRPEVYRFDIYEEDEKSYYDYTEQVIINNLKNYIIDILKKYNFADLIEFDFEGKKLELRKKDNSVYEVFVENKKICNVDIEGNKIYYC